MQQHVGCLVMVGLALGCTTEGDATDKSSADSGAHIHHVDAVTWHRDIRPLVDRHCAQCHTEGGIGPFTFDDAGQAAALGPAIVQSVADRTMPPFGADEDCRSIVDSEWLDDATMQAFADWGAADFPVGDPATYVAPTLPEPVPARDADIMVLPAQGFQPDFGQADDYLCMWGDHTFDSPTWLQAAGAVPDVDEIVHHVIVYAVPQTAWHLIDALDAADPGPGFSCLGGTLAELPVLSIGGWVPGGEVDAGSLSEEAAILVPKDSRVLIEMHYNLASVGPDTPTEDYTAIPIWTLPEGTEPTWRIETLTLYDATLDIPAGAASVTEEIELRVPFEGLLVGSSPHMHQLATGLDTTLIRPDGSEECLTRIDPWDFDWQRSYVWTDPVEVTAEDRFRLACTYDNSADNQPVIDGVKGDPVDVGWGDGSADEMCIDFLTTAVLWDADASEGVCAGFGDCYEGCADGDPGCAATCMARAGESCLACGMEAQLDGCGGTVCAEELRELGRCQLRCDDPYSDWYGCLVDNCTTEYDAYYACWQPAFEAGACDEALRSCGGLTP